MGKRKGDKMNGDKLLDSNEDEELEKVKMKLQIEKMCRYYEVHEMMIERCAKLAWAYFKSLKEAGFTHSDSLHIISTHGIFPKISTTGFDDEKDYLNSLDKDK